MSLPSFSTEVKIAKEHARLQLFLGICGLAVVLLFTLPGDLFTSGQWYDNYGMQMVSFGPAQLFGPDSKIAFLRKYPALSYEGTGFTLFLLCFNLMMALKTASAGVWAASHPTLWALVRGIIRNERIIRFNQVKATTFFLYIFGNLADTMFDVDFRAWGGAQGFSIYIKALAVSTFYWSLGSEWLLVESMKWISSGLGGVLNFRREQKKEPVQNLDRNRQQQQQQQRHHSGDNRPK